MAQNCSGCGCGSCGNSDRCTTRNSGALRAVRGANSCNCVNHCGCSGCGNNCGVCNSCTGCNVPSSCPRATTCAGSRLFYTGPCGRVNNCCCGVCHNDCGCRCHSCHGCCGGCEFSECEDECDCESSRSAAEFVAEAPQSCAAGEGFRFRAESCPGGGFSVCDGGVRIEKCGRYAAVYSFSAPAGANGATDLCLEVNGRSLNASRCHVEPAVFAGTRSAAGQALFTAEKGDVIALTTSTALSVPDSCGAPTATLIIYPVD